MIGNNEEREKKYRQRFIRWQERQIEHTSNLSNLLITLGIAVIGFVFSILNTNSYEKSKLHNSFKVLIVIGLVFLLISILFGILGGISRLHGFRATTQTIRARWKKYSDVNEHLEKMNKFDKLTWFCLEYQICAMVIGVLFIGCMILVSVKNMLFIDN